jgi:hypothetical protein
MFADMDACNISVPQNACENMAKIRSMQQVGFRRKHAKMWGNMHGCPSEKGELG